MILFQILHSQILFLFNFFLCKSYFYISSAKIEEIDFDGKTTTPKDNSCQ